MIKIDFENIVYNETTKAYQVIYNNECIFETKNEKESAIISSYIDLYGIEYFKTHKGILKKSYINNKDLPENIHWQPSQKRYFIMVNRKQLYASRNYDDVLKFNDYVKQYGVEKALKNKWKIVPKKRPGRAKQKETK